MTRLVLDCSIAMAWCFEGEANPTADSVLESLVTAEAVVPSIWPLEVANVLANSERQGRITPARTAQFLAMFGALPIVVDEQTTRKALSDVLALARAHGLSAYDAAYLELAMREGAELATLDERLGQVAAKIGVTVRSAS